MLITISEKSRRLLKPQQLSWAEFKRFIVYPYEWEILIGDAAQRYAAYMCEVQRKICAEHATVITEEKLIGYGEFPVQAHIANKDSILNAPLATDKNK